jgi:hypothetical protein
MPSAYADGIAVSTYADEARLGACSMNTRSSFLKVNDPSGFGVTAADFLGHTVAVYLSTYVKDADQGDLVAKVLAMGYRGLRVPVGT